VPPPLHASPSPRRYRATLAYDGAPFFGWQRQPARPTVQGAVETALARLAGVPVDVHSCGRTDTGVHALGQVAHFDLPRPWRAPDLQKGLNALLPDTVRVLSLRAVPSSFHARYDARAKEYRYFVWNAPVASPLACRTALHVRAPLDLDAMRAAAAALVGTHDFAAFSANPHRETSGTVRTVFSLDVSRRGPLVTLSVTGDGFLYKMVRSLAGHLVRVGRRAVPAADTASILASRVRTARVETAAARGLVLWRIYYSPLSRFPPPSHP